MSSRSANTLRAGRFTLNPVRAGIPDGYVLAMELGL